jgi:DME family drug/metabolite transporter
MRAEYHCAACARQLTTRPPGPIAPRDLPLTSRAAPDPNDRLGLAAAVAAATGLGLAVAFSRMAYEGGTNGLTVTTARALLMVAGLFALCRLTRRRLRLAPRDHLHLLGLGVLMAMMFYGNVGSVEFIPVGLAALLFYTFPPMVALITIVVVRERVPAARLAAIVTAFAGLAVMLGASLADSDPLGVALALGAAASAAWNSVWVARKLGPHDPLVLTFHMALVAAVLLVAVSVGSGMLQAPLTPSGWLGAALVVGLQASSIPLYFIALPRIGALKSSMVSNVQPVVSIVAAFVLYGELLAPAQFAGGALVLGAVWWMQRADTRMRLKR